MNKTDIVGYAMESLTDHMSDDKKELVIKYESILYIWKTVFMG